MSKLIVFVITVVSVIGFSGCAKHQTIPMCVSFDASKERTVYETNISTTEDVRAYSFNLEYVDNRPIDERKKLVKEPHYRFENTTIGKILGDFGATTINGVSMKKAGSRLLLKLTITQISEPLKPMKYLIGTSSPCEIDEKGNLFVNFTTVNPGGRIEVISNIGTHKGRGVGTAHDDSKESAWFKSIAYALLKKGDYHIKLEVLETSPEFKEIRTNFTISNASCGK